ncbi:MAG: GNAT family N-acetyltransferase [Mycobacteriales bacterium]
MSLPLVYDRHDAAGARQFLGELTTVYVEVYGGEGFVSAEKFRERFKLHTARSRFTLISARTAAGRLVGYAYGFSRGPDPELRAWQNLRPEVPPDLAAATRDHGVFVFCELVVREPHRRRHVGATLAHLLLERQTDPLAMLLVRKDNEPAQAAYRKWGWTKVGDLLPFPDAPDFDCLVRWLTPPPSGKP